MNTHPDWNYGYLRSDAYGFDPLLIVGAASAAVTAVSGAVTAGVNAKSQREQAATDERMARIQLLQSQQDAASSEGMLKVALAKSAQESAAQKDVAKTVVLGLAAVVVLGGLVYLGKDLLKEPAASAP